MPHLSFTSENHEDYAKRPDYSKRGLLINVNIDSTRAPFQRPMKTYEFDDDYQSIAASDNTITFDSPLIRREREKIKLKDMHSPPWRPGLYDSKGRSEDRYEEQASLRRVKGVKRGERPDARLKYRREVSVDANQKHDRLMRPYHPDRQLGPSLTPPFDHLTAETSRLQFDLRPELPQQSSETDMPYVRNSPMSLTMTSNTSSFASSIKRKMSRARTDEKIRGFGRRKRVQNSIIEDWNKSKMRSIEHGTSDEVKSSGFGRWFSSGRESERTKDRIKGRIRERAKDCKSARNEDCGNILDDTMCKDVPVISMQALDEPGHARPQSPSAAARLFVDAGWTMMTHSGKSK